MHAIEISDYRRSLAFQYLVISSGEGANENNRDNCVGLYTHNYSFNTNLQNSVNINETMAVFGQATLPIKERFRLTGGARYTRDYFKTVQNSSTIPENASNAFYKLTYKGGVEFDITPNSLAYAEVSDGFRQGGMGQSANSGAQYTFGPETIVAYEVGSKNKFLDGHLLFNVDAYLYNYDGYQLDVNFYPNPNSEVSKPKRRICPARRRSPALNSRARGSPHPPIESTTPRFTSTRISPTQK